MKSHLMLSQIQGIDKVNIALNQNGKNTAVN
jgi:hypothetical protein